VTTTVVVLAAHRHRQPLQDHVACATAAARWRALGRIAGTGRHHLDPLQQRLRNVVEEMAIASGVPVPEVYVLDRRTASTPSRPGTRRRMPRSPSPAARCERLTREELQGVIAHEFSHILNGDMRLNIRLIGWLFGCW
jgi:Zn-dependent protease with chaperone function